VVFIFYLENAEPSVVLVILKIPREQSDTD